MTIFADLHNSALAMSLRMLASRLSATIFFPIGTKWADEYWKIHEPYGFNQDTMKQYLQIKPEHKPVDGSPSLNSVVGRKNGYYEVEDKYHSDTFKSITLDQFIGMEIDIIIGSIPSHWVTFKKLRDKYKPKAKLICQLGNIMWDDQRLIKDAGVVNLMASVKEFPVDVPNKIFYHQEMPIAPFNPYESQEKQITSFVHLLPRKDDYLALKSLLPEFQFQAYGAGCPQGWATTLKDMYEKMRGSMFGFQNKPGADGFGHVVHSWAMFGRPLIINYDDYKDKLAGEFLIPDKTCIDITNITEEVVYKILRYSEPIRYAKMCFAIRKAWEDAVDYGREEIKLRQFFENLK